MARSFTIPGANRYAWLVVLATVLSLVANGCGLIPLASLGILVDIAGTAATAGPAVYKMGKLDIVFMDDFFRVCRAAESAADDLRLQAMGSQVTGEAHEEWKLELRDDLKSKITITVERRTPMLCRCRVDVGLLGSEPTARLVMMRIAAHLPAAPTTALGGDRNSLSETKASDARRTPLP